MKLNLRFQNYRNLKQYQLNKKIIQNRLENLNHPSQKYIKLQTALLQKYLKQLQKHEQDFIQNKKVKRY